MDEHCVELSDVGIVEHLQSHLEWLPQKGNQILGLPCDGDEADEVVAKIGN